MNRTHRIIGPIAMSLATGCSLLSCATDKPVMTLGRGTSVQRTSNQLTVALEADHPDQRRKALLALIHEPAARCPEAFEALDLIARTDRDHSVRRAALAVLAQYEDDRPLSTLLALLHDRDHPEAVRPTNAAIRWDAVNTVGELAARGILEPLSHPQAVHTLVVLLYDAPEHQVRLSAARSLRFFFCREAIAALAGAQSSQDFGVAFEAKASLRHMTGVEEEMELIAWNRWLDQARPATIGRPDPAASEPQTTAGYLGDQP